MIRVCLGFALALTGLAACCWAGDWFGLIGVLLGLLLMPSEDEEQARARRCTIVWRGTGFGFERRVQPRAQVRAQTR